jgi:hypothetical protein
MTYKLLALPVALGMLGMAATANAAPATMAGSALQADRAATNLIEPVTYGRCWRHGYYYCGRPAPRVYSFYVRPRAYYGYGYGYGFRRW